MSYADDLERWVRENPHPTESNARVQLYAGDWAKVLAALRSTEAVERDAARYRFLKARRGNIVEIAWNSLYSNIYATAKIGNVDAAIDAAMRQSAPEGKE